MKKWQTLDSTILSSEFTQSKSKTNKFFHLFDEGPVFFDEPVVSTHERAFWPFILKGSFSYGQAFPVASLTPGFGKQSEVISERQGMFSSYITIYWD